MDFRQNLFTSVSLNEEKEEEKKRIDIGTLNKINTCCEIQPYDVWSSKLGLLLAHSCVVVVVLAHQIMCNFKVIQGSIYDS